MTSVTRKLSRLCPTHVYSGGKSRAIIVEMQPPGTVIGFRLKGTRKTHSLPIDYCYREAVKATVASEKLARKKEREAKRKERER